MSKKPRLKVLSFAAAMKQLRSALTAVEVLKGHLAGTEERADTFRRERNHFEQQVKSARAEHDDLKRRLHDAKVETARLNGYLERVQERDRADEPLIEQKLTNGESMWTTKSQLLASNRPFMANAENYADFGGIDRTSPKHWTSY